MTQQNNQPEKEKCPKAVSVDDCGACPENGITCPKPVSSQPQPPILTDGEIQNIGHFKDWTGGQVTGEYREFCIAQSKATVDWMIQQGYHKDEPIEGELREELIDWITAYQDAAERNALAETPRESADYLLAEVQSAGYISKEQIEIEKDVVKAANALYIKRLKEQYEREIAEIFDDFSRKMPWIRQGTNEPIWREIKSKYPSQKSICASCGKPVEPGQDFVDNPLRHAGPECANKEKE